MKENDDPRSMPLEHCALLGELMYHIEEFKKLDKAEKETGLKKFDEKDFEI